MQSNETTLHFNETTLHFVKVGEFDGTVLQKAFESAKSKQLDVELVSGDELLQCGVEEDQFVFVTEEFTGDVFELLHAHKKRIFGPICVLECVENEIPLPNTLHPVYCLAMSGAQVSCTNVERPLRKKLRDLIEHMNGVFAKDFTDEVTHLVNGHAVGSAKYAFAAKSNKPIVLPSWVEEAWQRMQKQFHFDAKDAKFVDEYRCPIFKGLSICVTGLVPRRRKEIKRLVEENGGTYSPVLNSKGATHLLVEKPEGQKYQFAQSWNLHCVKPDWLFDCVHAAYWLDETQYLVKPSGALNSTCGGSNTTTVDATINSSVAVSEVASKAAHVAKQSAASYGGKELLLESSLARVQGHGLKSFHKSKHAPTEAGKCDYNIPIPSGELFLDGCRLYLTGFNELQLDYLQKIINAGGGTRFNQINPSVSHIVVGDKPTQDIEKLVNSEFSPHVVTVQWMLDSCRKVKCLSEQEYYYLESKDVFEEHRKSNENKGNDNDEMKKVEKKRNDDENDEILKQYLDLMQNDDLPSAMDDLQPDVAVAKNVDTSENKCDPADHVSKGSEQGVLHGLKFRSDGFTEEDEAHLEADIEHYGGRVLPSNSKTMADFVIVPLNYECDDNMRAKTVVTYCWLERCVRCRKILEPGGEFLFTPFSLAEDMFPLQDCVITISQYTDAKRAHLMHLIQVLGGYEQDMFSRIKCTRIDRLTKTPIELLANTHLILEEPTGSKYKAAVDWNLPAVSVDWLYECARTGTKVPEARFLLTQEKSPGIEKDQQGQSEDKASGVFNEFTVPENRSGKEGQVNHQETGDKSETSSGNHKTKDKEIALSSNKPDQSIPMKVPAFFGKPQRPVFDLTDALEVLQSPCASSGSSSAHSRLSRGSRNSFLMDDYIQEQLQAALKNTGSLLESRNDVQEHEGSTVDNEDDNEDNNEKKDNASSESSFLRGVVLVVSKKCAKQLAEIHNMATAVGAECKNSLDKTCTHLIHEGRLTKEQSQAKSKGVNVVSPHWLYDCIEQQCHLDESLYPTSYNPKLTLSSVVKTRRSTRSAKNIADDVNADVSNTFHDPRNTEETEKEPGGVSPETAKDEKENEITMDDLQTSEMEAIATFSQSSAQSDSLRTREEIKHIHDIMQSMNFKSSRRRSARLRRNSGNSGHSRNSSGNSGTGNESKRRASSSLRSLRSSKDDSDEEDDGQNMDIITYDDPKSRQERERIIAQLDDDSSPSPNAGNTLDNDETIDENQTTRSTRKNSDDFSHHTRTLKSEANSPTSPLRSSTPTAPPIALQITSRSVDLPEPVSLLDSAEEVEKVEIKPCPKFTLTVMPQQEKIDYAALIEDLGGVVFDNQFFNRASRHLVAGKLNRNEKCLSSIAAGNWVLRKSYLEACRKAGCFVDEEPHEWGVGISGESLDSMAIASRRWRTELAKKSELYKKSFGAFQDWKLLLCIEDSRVASFGRLLEAGGAEVLSTKPPFQKIAQATHVFIDPNASRVNDIDFNSLEQADLPVLRTQYISDYLIESPLPPASKYVFRPNSLQSSKKRKQCDDSEFLERPGKRKKVGDKNFITA